MKNEQALNVLFTYIYLSMTVNNKTLSKKFCFAKCNLYWLIRRAI